MTKDIKQQSDLIVKLMVQSANKLVEFSNYTDSNSPDARANLHAAHSIFITTQMNFNALLKEME